MSANLEITTNLDLRVGDVIVIHSRLGIHRYEIFNVEDLRPTLDHKLILIPFEYKTGGTTCQKN